MRSHQNRVSTHELHQSNHPYLSLSRIAACDRSDTDKRLSALQPGVGLVTRMDQGKSAFAPLLGCATKRREAATASAVALSLPQPGHAAAARINTAPKTCETECTRHSTKVSAGVNELHLGTARRVPRRHLHDGPDRPSTAAVHPLHTLTPLNAKCATPLSLHLLANVCSLLCGFLFLHRLR